MLYVYCYSLENVTSDFPTLHKKWEEKNTNCNMVHDVPRKNNKKNEEADV
jgi:hypothetical protein